MQFSVDAITITYLCTYFIYMYLLRVEIISAKNISLTRWSVRMQSARCFFSYLRRCQFYLPHMPRRVVVSRYISRRAFWHCHRFVCLMLTVHVEAMHISCRKRYKSVLLTTSSVDVVEVVAAGTSARASASKIGDGFNDDVDVELVVLITCYKTCCQHLKHFPLRLSRST
jgi:hypothetical protein